MQNLPYEVVSHERTCADGYVSQLHHHPRHQLLYSVAGLMMTNTADVTWAVPSGYGLFVPAGINHTTKMVGEVHLKTLYIKPDSMNGDDHETCHVVNISDLLISLIARLCQEEAGNQESDRAFHLRRLILLELEDAPVAPLALKLPTNPHLRRVCDKLTANPSNTWSIDQWALEAGKSRRSFTRLFRSQTGVTFGQWGQRLRYQLALTKMAQGM